MRGVGWIVGTLAFLLGVFGQVIVWLGGPWDASDPLLYIVTGLLFMHLADSRE